MQIDKDEFIKALTGSILCPSDMKIQIDKKDKICGFSLDCKRCWEEALGSESNIKLTGGSI